MARPLIHLVEATPGAIAGAGAGILSTDRDAPYSKKDVAKVVGGTVIGGLASSKVGRILATRNANKFNEAHKPAKVRNAIDTILNHASDPKSTFKSRLAVSTENIPTIAVGSDPQAKKLMADQIANSYFGRGVPKIPENLKTVVENSPREVANLNALRLMTLDKLRKF